jgi:hypothetical protein
MKTVESHGNCAQLCAYTGDIFLQMQGIVKPYGGPRMPFYREHVGAHLRHIIEHYETLASVLSEPETMARRVRAVDYDARARNIAIESDPEVALCRIRWLCNLFGALTAAHLECPVDVHVRGGLQGEHNFVSRSTVAREVMFLNSHATHHFAIMQAYAHQRGETLGAGVGKAPATVAHEQRLQRQCESVAA